MEQICKHKRFWYPFPISDSNEQPELPDLVFVKMGVFSLLNYFINMRNKIFKRKKIHNIEYVISDKTLFRMLFRSRREIRTLEI